jgi:hypothetical protein
VFWLVRILKIFLLETLVRIFKIFLLETTKPIELWLQEWSLCLL